MKQRSSSLILCFVLIVSFVASVSAQTCVHNGKNFIPNGTYDANRRLILSSLPSNAAAQDGFYSGSIGQEPSRVYAAGMCIPGAEANDCSACIKLKAHLTGWYKRVLLGTWSNSLPCPLLQQFFFRIRRLLGDCTSVR